MPVETRIEVDAKRIESEIDPRLYGHFLENMARCIYGGLMVNESACSPTGPWSLRGDLVDSVKRIRPTVIRWPGGLYADGYHWRDGIGPIEARPLRRNVYWSRYGPATRVLDPNRFGSDEYMRLVEELRSRPYVNVNLGTGGPEEAAAWVEYMNCGTETVEGARRASYGREEPWGVDLWGIGNETYGFWSLGHTGPDRYAQRYIEFKEAMSGVTDGMEYVAVGADRYLSRDWNRRLLDTVGEEADYLSIHVYLPGMERIAGVAAGRLRSGKSGMYRALVAASHDIERRIGEAEDDIVETLGENSRVRIALDEWNLWWKPSQLLFPRWTLRDALFACGVLNALHRQSHRVSIANIAQLVNVLGVLTARGDRFCRTAMYYPFLLYASDSPGSSVAVSTSCGVFSSPALGGIPAMSEVPVLDCSALFSRRSGTLKIFVVNRDPDAAVRCSLELKGVSAGDRVVVETLNGPGIDSANTFSDDGVVGITSKEMEADEVFPEYTFPAHSATAIVIDAG